MRKPNQKECHLYTYIFSFLSLSPTELDMLALLPDLNSLLSSRQLVEKGLSDDPTFCLLMKAGYEQVARVQSHIVATNASRPDDSMT